MGLRDDINFALRRKDDMVIRLITINVAVFLIMVVLYVFSEISRVPLLGYITNWTALNSNAETFITRPWTILTYSFMHSMRSIFHIIFNMLWFYWFGKMIQDYLGKDKVLALYVLGAIAGGVFYLLSYNFIPYYIERSFRTSNILVGASASVNAIVLAAATLLPNQRINLMFLGSIKITWIAAFVVLTSFLGTVGSNAGGNLAHLGGALIGFLYIRALNKGTDIGKWIISIRDFFANIGKPKSKMNVSYKNVKYTKVKDDKKSKKSTNDGTVSQAEIDKILDKISKSGYESLTKEEKQKLFNASKK